MRKIYVLLVLVIMANIGFAQKYYSQSDEKSYDVSDILLLNSIQQGASSMDEAAVMVDNFFGLDTVMAGDHLNIYSNTKTRGYYFQAQSNFKILGLMSAEDTNPDALRQSVEIVSFGAVSPEAFSTSPGTPYTTLLSKINVSAGWVDCDVDIVAGNYYGIIGAKHDDGGSIMYNSYGASNVDLVMAGFATNCSRLILQSALSAGSPASGSYYSSSDSYIGRVHVRVSGCPTNLVVENDPGESGAIVNFSLPDGVSVTSAIPSGGFFPIGVSDVITDGECSFSVTVMDVEPPEAQCHSIDIYLDRSGKYVLDDDDMAVLTAGTTDNDTVNKVITYAVSPPGFSCDDVISEDGLTVNVTSTDPSGNSSYCLAVVNVIDTFVVVEPVEDVEMTLDPGVCETTISYPEFVTNDCVTFEQISGLGPDGIFPIGTTTEIWKWIYPGVGSTEFSFDVIITGTNGVPALDSIFDYDVDEDATLMINLTGISGGGDCDEQVVSVMAVGKNPTLITNIAVIYTSPDATGSLDLTIAPGESGMDSITVTVSDDAGGSVMRSFKVTVNPVNDPPYLISPLPDAVVNADYNFTLSMEMMDVIFADDDDDMLVFEIMIEGTDTIPAWAVVNSENFIGSPHIPDTGSYSFVVIATDAAGAMARDTFMLKVDGFPTAIGDINSGSFEITMFPNPSRGEVNLELKSSGLSDIDVAVMDITGKLVLSKQYFAAEKIRFDMSDQVSGMYFVKIGINGKQVFRKLILKK